MPTILIELAIIWCALMGIFGIVAVIAHICKWADDFLISWPFEE